MGNDNILIVVVLAVIGYFFLSQKKEGETAEGYTAPPGQEKITSGCPKGQSFYKGIIEYIIGCPAGYESVGGWLGTGDPGGEGCQCKSARATDGTPIQSPQTPAPTPIQKCPWDSNLIYGDARCTALYPQYPTSEGSISSSELCDPSSPYYVGDAVANAPGGCYG